MSKVGRITKPGWKNISEARQAVTKHCEARFAKVFRDPVPTGWAQDWHDTFAIALETENEARQIARDFARLSLERARSEARAFIKRIVKEKVRYKWTPLVMALREYLEDETRSDEPFTIEGTKGTTLKSLNPKDRPLFRKGVVVELTDTRATLRLPDGTKAEIPITYRKGRRRHGGAKRILRDERGALLKPTSIEHFVLWNFERLLYDDGPKSWVIARNVSAKLRKPRGEMYLTDGELAVLAALIDPNWIKVTKSNLEKKTPPGALLDRGRAQLARVRRRFGFLYTAEPPLSETRSRSRKPKRMNRREWIDYELKTHRAELVSKRMQLRKSNVLWWDAQVNRSWWPILPSPR